MSLISLVAAAGLLATQPQAVPPIDDDTTVLDEIVVEGRQLDTYVRDFVNEIAAPARRRGLARWHSNLCVGVVNLRPDTAQAIADRVSGVAQELGLTPGDPGCSPNIFIIAAEDGRAVADQWVQREPSTFRLGSSATDLGASALRAFQDEERPVRWWVTSMPIDSDTGTIAIRLPGQTNSATGGPDAPVIDRFAASRLSSQIRDDIVRAFVIIDIDQMRGKTVAQLADYAAMVTLAQIDPDATVDGYRTILGLFSDEDAPSGLTDWDMTYLRALYATHPPRVNPGSQVSAVTNEVISARRDAAESEDAAIDN
ncbi:hypothetical protein [Brevundimonas sp.]|uniref:hypothetical protein n=1 Tax=Brevundimonas sp. TaxID=1871086 RepID=UPI0035AEE3A1